MSYLTRFRNAFIVAASVSVLAFVALADQNSPPPATQPYPLDVCVVTGDKLGGAMGEPKVIQFDGREVRLCCAGCEKDFRNDPAKYLKKLDDATANPSTQPTTQTADVYTCPMHSDVRSEKAGQCPKCGMDLKKQKPAATPHQH